MGGFVVSGHHLSFLGLADQMTLTQEEIRFLLRLMAEHRQYYRMLAEHPKHSHESKVKSEKIETLAKKLEALRDIPV